MTNIRIGVTCNMVSKLYKDLYSIHVLEHANTRSITKRSFNITYFS